MCKGTAENISKHLINQVILLERNTLNSLEFVDKCVRSGYVLDYIHNVYKLFKDKSILKGSTFIENCKVRCTDTMCCLW